MTFEQIKNNLTGADIADFIMNKCEETYCAKCPVRNACKERAAYENMLEEDGGKPELEYDLDAGQVVCCALAGLDILQVHAPKLPKLPDEMWFIYGGYKYITFRSARMCGYGFNTIREDGSMVSTERHLYDAIMDAKVDAMDRA